MTTLAIKCVLFDLDGTLADTAPDLAAPIHAMRAARGLSPMPYESLRPFASMGARGLIGQGLGVDKEDPRFPALRDEFLQRYEDNICVHTKLFPGMSQVLTTLEDKGIIWGIVSNKIERYVRLLANALQLDQRSTCLIGGDTAGVAKPDPAPLLLGAKQSRVEPGQCIYVGDDLRDVQAGKAATMRTIAVSYGYNGAHDPPQHWGSDYLVDSADQIIQVIECLQT